MLDQYIGKVAQLIYVDRKGEVSFRNVRVLSVKGERMKAYCYSAQAVRIFNFAGIVDIEVIWEGRKVAKL